MMRDGNWLAWGGSLLTVIKHVVRPRILWRYLEAMRVLHISDEQLAAFNWNKRLRIVRYAYQNVPYYRRIFKENGIEDPRDIRCEEDWEQLPILRREDVVANSHDLIDESVSRRYLVPTSTGGTTGKPLKLYRDRRFPSKVFQWRALHLCGLSPGVHEACMSRVPTRQNLVGKIKHYPTRRVVVDTSSLSESDIVRFMEQYNRVKPRLIRGYPAAIAHIAQFVEAHGVAVHSPEAIWVTSAPITQVQKAIIERVFGAPVYDQYGSCEIHWIAQQCGIREGLHINSDIVHLEIVGSSGLPCNAGVEGSVLVTDLDNYVFPLIRYKNGDLGKLLDKHCSCGVTLPLMAPIKGRISDVVRLPDGGIITGEFLTTVFDPFPDAVREFQILQKKDYSLLLSVVLNADNACASEQVERVASILRAKVRNQMTVTVNVVSDIPNDLVKTRYVVSELR